jgi:hypothetical protein
METSPSGSREVATWHGVGKTESTIKAYALYRAQHDRLVADGAILVEDGRGRLTRDVVFGSPPAAGTVALGRSCNDRREWIAPGGIMFGAWESRGIN